MAKYYVKSGTLEVIISRKDALEAAICGFLMTNKFDVIDEYFYIDERGYRDYISADKQTKVYKSINVLTQAGWNLEK